MESSIDREKVIKGLHCCAHADGTNCVYCPYDITDENCTALMSMDVLDLLKEQEPVEPIIEQKVFQYARCGKCGQVLHWQGNYCHWCGRAVKWE